MHERGPRGDRARNHDAAWFEPAVAGRDDGLEHTFVDPEPAEPLRDDHVDAFGQRDVGDVAVDDLDDLADPIRSRQLVCKGGNGRALDCVHARRARPRREHTENAASGTDIQDDVARAHHRVDRTEECFRARTVANHRAVHLDLRVHRIERVPDRRPHACIVLLRTER